MYVWWDTQRGLAAFGQSLETCLLIGARMCGVHGDLMRVAS